MPDRHPLLGQPKAKNRISGIMVSEISFVDEPAVPKARFVVVKRKEVEEEASGDADFRGGCSYCGFGSKDAANKSQACAFCWNIPQ